MLTPTTPTDSPVSPPVAPKPPSRPDFDDALNDARRDRSAQDGGSDERRGDEIAHQVVPGESLYRIAQEYDASYAGVLEANPQFSDPDRIAPGEIVFVPGAGERTVKLYDSARRYAQSRESVESAQDRLSDPADRGAARAELPDLEREAGQREAEFRELVSTALREAGGQEGRPELRARERLETLKLQLPDEAGIDETLDAVYAELESEWRAQGSTDDRLTPLETRFEAVSNAERNLHAAMDSGPAGRAEIPVLQATLNDKRSQLERTIRRQLESTLDQAAAELPPKDGKPLTAADLSPTQRELTLTARATVMTRQGPDDEAFRRIVDDALYDLTVQPGIDAVETAYRDDGAAAAARVLRERTQDVSPATAERIVADSLPTLERIAADLDASLTSPDAPIERDAIEGVYLDLAAATDRAARGVGGEAVVEDVAKVMAEHLPASKANDFPVMPYLEAVSHSVKDSGGTLALATAAQLEKTGRHDEAASLVGWTEAGLNDLREQIKDTLTDFRDATEVTARLRQDWSGTMTREQLDDATLAYVKRHPEILDDFDDSYRAIDDLGYAATRAGLALDRYLPELSGLERTEGLAEERERFFGSDEATQAMGLSERSRDEVLFQATGEGEDGETAAERSRDSSARTARTLVKELGQMATRSSVSMAMLGDVGQTGGTASANAGRTLDAFTGRQNVEFDPNKVSPFAGSMNGLGALFNGYMAKSSMERIDFERNPDSLMEATKSVYYAIGTGKEVTELLAAGAQTRFFRDWLSPTANTLTQSILSKAQRTGLMNEPGWVRFSSFFGIGGGVLDGIYAGKSAAEGDWGAAGLYGLSSAGGLTAAASTFAANGWLATWGGPVGVGVSFASTLGLYFYNDYKEDHRFEEPAEEFLTDAGFEPEVARELAQQGPDGQIAGPGIAATAERFDVEPDSLFEGLNELDPEVVKMLAEAAWTVQPDDSGEFPVTADNDRNVWAPPGKDPQFGGEYLYDPGDDRYRGDFGQYGERLEDPNPRSLTALRDYARALTDEPMLG